MTKSVCVIVEACGEGRRGCWGGEAKDESGEREEVVEVREGEATGPVGGGGGGRVMTVATTGVGTEVEVGTRGSMRTGEGEESSSRTPEEDEDEELPLPTPSTWSGDMAPSLLDSSSY